MISILRSLLLAVVFLTPLLGAGENFSYEQIKVLFFIVSFSLIGLFWLITKPTIGWTNITKAGGIFIAILLLTSFSGIDFRNSLLGNEPYFQGWVLYADLFLFSLMVSWAKIEFKWWAMVLAGSASLVAILAISDWILLNFFGQQILTYAGRVVSTFGQPNFYAGFLLLTLPFAYYLLKSSNRKASYFGTISGLIAAIGIFVSYSRSTILLALLLLIWGLTDQLKIKFRIGLVIFLVVLISILIALKSSSGIVGNEVSEPIVTRNPDLTRESVEKRVYIWLEGLKIALQKPLIGYGLENIGSAFANYFEDNKHQLFEENLNIYPVLISLKELNIDRTHNYILDLLLFSGILGLLGWFGLLAVLVKKLRQISHGPLKNVLIVSLATYLVWIQFQNQSMVHLIFFWLLVGLVGGVLTGRSSGSKVKSDG